MSDPQPDLSLSHVGLFPVFTSHAKLYINQLLSVQHLDQQKGVFMYKGHPIMNVDIIGRVTRIQRTQRFIKYQVDDGTGVVTVVCWPADDCGDLALSECNDILGESLSAKLQDLLTERENHEEPYLLGDLIHVRGRIKFMFGQLEVSASYNEKLDNAMHEVLRMAEMPRINREIYNKPAQPPPLIQQQLRSGQHPDSNQHAMGILAVKAEGLLIAGMEQCPPNCLIMANELSSFLQELFCEDNVSCPEKQNAIIDVAATALIKKGHMFAANRQNSAYKLVSKCKILHDAIVSVMKYLIDQQYDVEQQGCHAIKIYYKLRDQSDFAYISREAVNKMLSIMEEESEIISTADNCFMLFNG